jgi:hypothetical protein
MNLQQKVIKNKVGLLKLLRGAQRRLAQRSRRHVVHVDVAVDGSPENDREFRSFASDRPRD